MAKRFVYLYFSKSGKFSTVPYLPKDIHHDNYHFIDYSSTVGLDQLDLMRIYFIMVRKPTIEAIKKYMQDFPDTTVADEVIHSVQMLLNPDAWINIQSDFFTSLIEKIMAGYSDLEIRIYFYEIMFRLSDIIVSLKKYQVEDDENFRNEILQYNLISRIEKMNRWQETISSYKQIVANGDKSDE